jgi:hypothetical protein
MTIDITKQFNSELRSFFSVTFLNVVLGAFVLALGTQGIANALMHVGDFQTYYLIQGIAGVAGAALGSLWILSSARILNEILPLQREYREIEKPISRNALIDLIIWMVSLYRDNRGNVQILSVASMLSAVSIFVLGLVTSLEAFGINSGGITFTLNNLQVIPRMLLTVGIVVASLLSSRYFSRFAGIWNGRLHDIEQSEHGLKTRLGLKEG